jgi:hypothetical protein
VPIPRHAIHEPCLEFVGYQGMCDPATRFLISPLSKRRPSSIWTTIRSLAASVGPCGQTVSTVVISTLRIPSPVAHGLSVAAAPSTNGGPTDVQSPPGFSILINLALRSARICPAKGAATLWPSSITTWPASGSDEAGVVQSVSRFLRSRPYCAIAGLHRGSRRTQRFRLSRKIAPVRASKPCESPALCADSRKFGASHSGESAGRGSTLNTSE